ncbi:membrane protein [Alkalibacterium putridalgicola]|nr:membrane protein [Alkalibacterium putridalgicola]
MFLSILLSLTSYVKYQYRVEPLYPNELGMVTNLSELATMVSTADILMAAGVILLTSITTFILYKKFSTKKEYISPKTVHYGWRILTLIISTFFMIYVTHFNGSGNQIKEHFSNYTRWVTYNQNMNYQRNGFIAGFLYNLGTVNMEEPEDYSRDEIERIYKKYLEEAEKINQNRTQSKINTNLIYIMNESFSDPTKINGFSTDQDPIPYTRELLNNTLSGESLALNIGGGTANSEFEALTSLSKEPFRVSVPFVEAVNIMHKVPSIVKKANNDKLTTTAIHPYDPTLYRRLSVYEKLGFSEFLYAKNMKNTEKMGNSRHISDRSAYKESIEVIEKTEEKDFIHLVTMQNHGPYQGKYEDLKFSTNANGTESSLEADSYLEDLHNSDLALKEFLEYLENQEEEFLVVFWGDHLPGIYSEEVLSENSDLNMRETPLFFYSNKQELSGDVGTISPMFHTNQVLDILDIEVSPYEALVDNLEQKLPGLNGGVYLERNSEKVISSRNELSKEAQAILKDFNLVQYDIVSGNEYGKKLGLFEIKSQ